MANDDEAVLFVDVVSDASPLGCCESWLEIEAQVAFGHGLSLQGLAEVVSAENESNTISCLVGLVARVRVYCGHERPGTRLILARGSGYQGAATLRLRAVASVRPWRVVELCGSGEGVDFDDDDAISRQRGAVAARLRGRLLKRGGFVETLRGGQLRVCACFFSTASSSLEPKEEEWGVVADETVVVVRNEPRSETYGCYVSETTRNEHVESWIRRIVEEADSSKLPKTMLLHGESGIGKTTLAVTSASACRDVQVFFAADELLEVEIEAAMAVALAGFPAVLVLDDLDVSCPRSSTDRLSLRNVLAVVKMLKNLPPRFAVVAVTSSLKTVHPFARKVFTEWQVHRSDLWHRSARLALLKTFFDEDDTDCEKAADLSVSLSGPEISGAIYAARAQGTSALSAIARIAKIVEKVGDEQVRWSDVAGLREAKKAMRRAVVYPRLYSDQLEALGVEPPTGVLLFGPPGVGKTMLARAAAVESGARLFILTPSGVVSDRMGVSERIVSDTFKAANASKPSLIFIDEFDSLFPSRLTVDPGQLGGSLVSTLCVAFDDLRRRPFRTTTKEETHDRLGVVVLAASNRPDAIDPALLQHGRFDYAIRIDLPDDQDRREHIRLLCRNSSNEDEDDDDKEEMEGGGLEDWLVERTRGFSGADIASLFTNASQALLSDEVNHEDPTKNERCKGHLRRSLGRGHFEKAFEVTRTLQEEIDAAAEKEEEGRSTREKPQRRRRDLQESGTVPISPASSSFPIVSAGRGRLLSGGGGLDSDDDACDYYSTLGLPRD